MNKYYFIDADTKHKVLVNLDNILQHSDLSNVDNYDVYCTFYYIIFDMLPREMFCEAEDGAASVGVRNIELIAQERKCVIKDLLIDFFTEKNMLQFIIA